MDTSMIRQVIRSRQQELVDLAASLIRIPSENPSPSFIKHTAEIGGTISQYLASKGFLITEHRRNEENSPVSLFCDAPLTNEDGPRLLFCGHTDVVPAGDRSKWSFDPFSGEVRSGMLLGRGASDMKGGLASLIFVAGLLQEFAHALHLKGSLSVITSPDEETGGMEVSSLLSQGLIKGEACVIGEPTYPRQPNAGEKSEAWMQVTIPGKSGHGSQYPLSGISAVRRAADVVVALSKISELIATPPLELNQLLYNTEWFFSQDLKKPLLSQLLYRPSYNPGVIRGGTNVNVVADKCMIQVDCRVPFGMKPELVLEVARNIVNAIAPDAIVEQIVPPSNPNWTLQNRPIVRATELGIRQVLGMEKPVYSILLIGSSDASHFRRHGIDTVNYGPGNLDTIHGYDELVSVKNLVDSAEVYAETAINFLTSY